MTVGQAFPVRNPHTGRIDDYVEATPPPEVAAVVHRAREAQAAWAAAGARHRGEILRKLPGVMLSRLDEIGRVVSRENGKAPAEAKTLVLPGSAAARYYADLAEKVDGGVDVGATFFVGSTAHVSRRPLGVAGQILPWNMPFEIGVKNAIQALAAGCAVVQKPSERTPRIGELVRSLFLEAGVPEPLFGLVQGGGEVGQALVDEVDVVLFIGSTRVGRRIAVAAAERLVPCILELGGKDPAIVRADADVARTARGLVTGTCFNGGQVCNGIERIYVHRSVHDAVVDEVLDVVGRLQRGTVGDESYELGPVTMPSQVRVYEAHTKDAVAKGAALRAGGSVHEDGGLWWDPTVLTGCDHTMAVMTEETFGPFLPFMAYDDDAEALALANDTPYGLGASVWTADEAVGKRMAGHLEAGTVMVNNAVQVGGCITVPFGGMGASGYGRVQGRDGFFAYTHAQGVMTSPASAADLWMPYGERTGPMTDGLVRMFEGKGVQRVRGLLGFLWNKG